jgi:hypothetical protein
LAHANRCFNNDLLPLLGVTSSVVEENELYAFHRWGIVSGEGSGGNEIRRNYANPRGAYGAANATCSTYGSGPATIGPYHGQGDLFENNVVENPSNSDAGNHEGFDIEAESSNDAYLGNVALNMRFILAAHVEDPQPSGNRYADDVGIDAPAAAFWLRGGRSTNVDHCSIFGPGVSTVMGFGLNPGIGSNAPASYTGGFGLVVANSQVDNLASGTDGAFFIAGNILSGYGGTVFSFDHNNTYADPVTYNPNTNVTQARQSGEVGGFHEDVTTWFRALASREEQVNTTEEEVSGFQEEESDFLAEVIR